MLAVEKKQVLRATHTSMISSSRPNPVVSVSTTRTRGKDIGNNLPVNISYTARGEQRNYTLTQLLDTGFRTLDICENSFVR